MATAKVTPKKFVPTIEVSNYRVEVVNNTIFIKWVSARHNKDWELQNSFYTYKFAKGITLNTINDFLSSTNADFISKEINDRFIEKWIARKIVKSEIDEAMEAEMDEPA